MKPAWRPAAPGLPDSLLAAALRAEDEGVYLARFTRGAEGLEIVFANETLGTMVGRTAAALQGHGPAWLHADRADVQRLARWRRTARAGHPLTGEGYLLRQDGSTLHAAWTVSVIPATRGRVTHVVASYRDTTEKRRLQEALMHAQRLDAVGRLAGGVAHDFNNLLSVINGYCQILAGQVADQPRILKEVEEIHRAGQKAAALTRQLLAFGRRQPLKTRVININRFVRSQAEILARLLGTAGQLELALDPNVGQVRIDPAQLQQILLNLTLNARDALRRRGVVLIRTARRRVKAGLNRRFTDNAPGDYVGLSVVDNGTGMSPETQRQLFEPFFTTKQVNQGTGLGLAVVHGVVESHQGGIEVESTVGTGSVFSIYLPLANTAVPAAIASNSDFPSGGESLLIVDDEDSLRELLTEAFHRKGYKISTASNGHEAIDLISDESRHYDLVLLDLNLPNASGLQVMKVIRLCRPGTCVLVVSGHITPEIRADFQQIGQRDFMMKPYTLDEMGRRIRTLLDARAATRP